MGGVISHGDENWFVAGYEFRELLGRTKEKLDRADDLWKVDQAGALHGLHFDLLDDGQAKRLAEALGRAAAELRSEMTQREPRDEREARFRDHLPELAELVAG